MIFLKNNLKPSEMQYFLLLIVVDIMLQITHKSTYDY